MDLPDLIGELPDLIGELPGEEHAKRVHAGDTDRELDDVELAFVGAVLEGYTQTTAYLKANPTYTGSNAGHLGYAMGKKASVRRALDKAIAERYESARAHATKNTHRLLDEYLRIAFFDPAELFDNTGRPKPIQEINRDTRSAIVGLEVVDEFDGRGKDRQQIGTVKKYKVADKQKALDSLAKILGLMIERTEVTGKDGAELIPQLSEDQLAQRIAFVLQRAAHKVDNPPKS